MNCKLPCAIDEFYRLALTVNSQTNPSEVLGKILADDFLSINSQESKDKATLTKQLGFFWKLIPNLKWEPQDGVTEGNKVVVRSIAAGAPVGNFMGLECTGSKSFRIDTIDIHELRDGKIVRVHHLEDWGTAMKQLKA